MPSRIPLLLAALAAPAAHASAPPQCVRATLSQNARVLVLNDLTFANPGQTSGSPIRSTFLILNPSVEPTEGLRVNGPATYWTAPLWSVTFSRQSTTSFLPICSHALVTNDAEFLILLTGLDQLDGLTIFRRRYHPGRHLDQPPREPSILIRQVPLNDLGVAPLTSSSDTTSKWFAGGRFTVLGNSTLRFTNAHGARVLLDLTTGYRLTPTPPFHRHQNRP